ncbi:MAG: NRDE family protein [Alcanivorax sediminis]|uniref:NRDE family protein n=1 Tax=Alcanivorax sediminis TaxID=2663008 RepID=UPI003C49FCF7
MCIVLLDWQPGSDIPLRVAANRDEFHARPAEPARWRGDIFCGLDLTAGGTWLGIHRNGRFAVVTNYREPITDRQPGERSRGLLPSAFLTSTASPEQFARELAQEQQHYGAFNLLVGTPDSLWYLGNRGANPQPVTPGIHGLSNGLMDDPWPKVNRAKRHLQEVIDKGGSLERLLDVVTDRHQPADDELPDTGVGLDLERLVAPVFIESPTYGTRASSAVILDRDNGPQMLEQCWQPDGCRAERTCSD